MRQRRKSRVSGLAALLIPLLIIAAAVIFARGADRLDADRGAEAKTRLEDAILRGCAACYAAEGQYPQSLEYLEEHYGLQIDEEHFAVFYEPFGSNLMPNFTVLERKP